MKSQNEKKQTGEKTHEAANKTKKATTAEKEHNTKASEKKETKKHS